MAYKFNPFTGKLEEYGPVLTGTGTVSAAADGTAALPGIAFANDLNTGIYRPGADQLAISTGGSGRLFVDASGIIKANNSLRLANSGSGEAKLLYTGTSNDVFPELAGIYSDADYGVSTATALLIKTTLAGQTTPTERLRITSAGLVGIGTSSPGAELDVRGGANIGDATSTVRITADGTNGYISTSTNHPLRIRTNNLNAITIDTSQRVGIGTTSVTNLLHLRSDSSSNVDHLYLQNRNGGANSGARIAFSNGTVDYSDNRYAYIGAVNTGASESGNHLVFATNAPGAAATEKARIDSSGRLLVGTSDGSGGVSKLVVQGASNGSAVGVAQISYNGLASAGLGAGTDIGYLRFTDQGSNSGVFAQITATVDATSGANDYPGRLVFSTTADGASSPTERMNIRNGGDTGIFCDANSDVLYLSATAAAGTSRYLLIGKHSATGTITSGTISLLVFTNGNIQNTNNSYAGISDIKLKENIVDANSQWDDIKALQVRKYNFKEGQTHRQIGLIAQEVEPISPGLVYESPDRDAEGNDLGTVTKSVNYSVLYMKAVKALQEAMERIETLEAKVAALEAA